MYIAKNVMALYPKLDKPYRFDKAEEKSVACGPFEDGAAYELSFRIAKEDPVSKEIWAYLQTCWDDFCKAKGKKIKMKDYPFKDDKEDPAYLVFKTKLKAAYGTDKTTPPAVFNAANQAIKDEEFFLTTGSTINVAFTGVPYSGVMGDGVSLRLRAVQVIDLAEMAGGSSPFEVDAAAVEAQMAGMAALTGKGQGYTEEPEEEDPLNDDIPF